MTDRPQPPDATVDEVRAIAMSLADADEHHAWTGTSWRIGATTFAHLVEISNGWPPAYAKAFDTHGPATVVTFQADTDERHALADLGHPFHLPPWRPGIVGLIVDADTDWTELAELITDSHRISAS